MCQVRHISSSLHSILLSSGDPTEPAKALEEVPILLGLTLADQPPLNHVTLEFLVQSLCERVLNKLLSAM